MIRKNLISHDVSDLLPEVEKYLRSDQEILFAYLFGSRARVSVNPFSDIDIAVYLSGAAHVEARFRILGELMSIFKT